MSNKPFRFRVPFCFPPSLPLLPSSSSLPPPSPSFFCFSPFSSSSFSSSYSIGNMVVSSTSITLDSDSNITVTGCIQPTLSSLNLNVKNISDPNITLSSDRRNVTAYLPLYWASSSCAPPNFTSIGVNTTGIACQEAKNVQSKVYLLLSSF